MNEWQEGFLRQRKGGLSSAINRWTKTVEGLSGQFEIVTKNRKNIPMSQAIDPTAHMIYDNATKTQTVLHFDIETTA